MRRRPERKRSRSLLARLAILAAAAVVLLADPLLAADCGDVQLQPPPEFDFELEEPLDRIPPGHWFGDGSVVGQGSGRDQTLQVFWRGDLDLELDFVVEGDPGRLGGHWELSGIGYTQEQGIIEGKEAYVEVDYEIEGEGRLDGDNTSILLSGNGTNTGSAYFSAGGTSGTQAVNTTFPISEILSMQVETATCTMAHGPLILTIQDQGVSAVMTGQWSAVSLTEEVQAEADRIISEADTAGDVTSETSPFLQNMGETLAGFDQFLSSGYPWPIQDLFDQLNTLENMLNTLRGLSPCEANLLGTGNVHEFASMATAGIQRAIAALGANYDGLSGADLQALTQLAVRTGAIGAGAYNSNRAAQAESVLHSHAERILKQNVDPNDKRQLIVNDDVVATMSLGAAMGWEFQIRGQTLNAQNTWAQFHDTDGNKQSSVTPPGLEGCEA